MNTVRNQKTELDIPEKESVKYGMSMYSGDENYRCENDMYVYVCDLYVILHFLQNESKDQQAREQEICYVSSFEMTCYWQQW